MAVRIGNKNVGPGYPCFIIAEIGINHNGSLEIAYQLINAAIEAGCDAIKFQKRTVNVVYSKDELAKPRKVDPTIIANAMERMNIEGIEYEVFPDESAVERLRNDISSTLNGDLKYALEFGMKEYDLIDTYCQEKGILWFASSWDGLSAHFMNGYHVACHKIASACLTNRDLLERVRSNGKPVILSTGGSTIDQVIKAVKILGREDLIILHCIANYPCLDREINLNMIETLAHIFPGVPIGYSGHEEDILPSLCAVVKGASVVERHITLDRNMPGSDHKASLETKDFKELVSQIRRFERISGNGVKTVLPTEEAMMKKLRRKTNF